MAAHEWNVGGTRNLLGLATAQARSHGHPVLYFYPSSIAAYGVPAEIADDGPPLAEHRHNQPITMYGCNKLY